MLFFTVTEEQFSSDYIPSAQFEFFEVLFSFHLPLFPALSVHFWQVLLFLLVLLRLGNEQMFDLKKYVY